MPDMKTNDYDEIAYTKHVYKQTQPDNLATIASLFGMQPPPVETCRVLELGCASGMNLLAMAQAIPAGEFIGIDLSQRQIQEGQSYIRQLGFTNITLRQMDIIDIGEELGQFDYIIAHGVYSWVSPAVRDKILQVCRSHLSARGVAYISYNVYPGWHVDVMVRQMMLYRTQYLDTPAERLTEAKNLLGFLEQAIKHKFDTYSLSLRKELHRINQLEDNYFFHEYLEHDNEPIFFYEFVKRLYRYGLQYLADTKSLFISTEQFFASTEPISLSLIEKEQYLDFLRNNPYRETLLCLQEVILNRNLVSDKISDFHIAAPLKLTESHSATQLESSAKLKHDLLEQFENLEGRVVLSVTSPLLKAVCLCLGEVWPRSLLLDKLLQQVVTWLTQIDKNYQALLTAANIDEVKTMLLEFYLQDIVELSSYPPQFTLQISDCPLASPVARLQSQQGKYVTNLRYEVFALNSITREILAHLDGKHDRYLLLEVMQKNIVEGKLLLYQGEDKKRLIDVDQNELHQRLVDRLEEILHDLAKKAYLIA